MSAKSGVFIPSARSDGSDYVAWLRRILEKEHPEIPLWQDVISERAGKDCGCRSPTLSITSPT